MGRKGDSLEIRGDTMRISFYYEGKRYRPTLKIGDEPMKPTKANQLHGKRLAEEVKAKIKLGTFVMAEYFPESGEAGATTVGKQLTTWLESQRLEDSTKAGYAAAANFWRASLGHLVLREVKLSQILKVVADRPELSGKTLNNYKSVLKKAFELAVHDGILDTNPVVKVPSAKWQQLPPDPFTAQERDAIIERAEQKYPGNVANMIRFWMWTGLRTGELIGLNWNNVDLASKTILVSETKVRKKLKASTKTHMARQVRLNSQALAAITAQKAITYLAGGPVFHNPRAGESWSTEASFRKMYWIPLLKSLGIRYRRPYQCRHTYATTMLMAKMNPAMCAKQLGHDVKVFLTKYAKWIEGEADDREMALLEKAIDPKGAEGFSPKLVPGAGG